MPQFIHTNKIHGYRYIFSLHGVIIRSGFYDDPLLCAEMFRKHLRKLRVTREEIDSVTKQQLLVTK